MTRRDVHVRDAVPDDLPVLLSLYDELREAGPRRRPAGQPVRNGVSERYAAAIADPDQRLLVATLDGEAIGMALLGLGPVSNIADNPAVIMSHVCVTHRFRRHGAGKALIAAAATWGEERGAESVAIGLYPTSRDTNRFYARLGFAPVVVRRAASLATLRRKLGLEQHAPVTADTNHLARRGRLRARATSVRVVTAARRRES